MLKISFKSGIITILLMLIWSIFIYTLNINTLPIVLVQYFLYGLGIYSSHYFYKKNYHSLTYKNAFKLGLGVSTVVSFFYGGIIFLISLNKKSFLNKMDIKNLIIEKLKNNGIEAFQIQIIINKMQWFFDPINFSIAIFTFFFMLGIIISLIVSIFSRTKNSYE